LEGDNVQRLVRTTDTRVIVREEDGTIHFVNRAQARYYASAAELHEADIRHRAAQWPLPQPYYDPATGSYHWGDGRMQTAEEIAIDILKVWPLANVRAILD
jgi:hypothetical protein